MNPKKSELLDTYLRNEINKVSFEYNPDHWAELKNNLDHMQAKGDPAVRKQNLWKGFNKNLLFFMIVIPSAIVIYLLNSGDVRNVWKAVENSNMEIQAPVDTKPAPFKNVASDQADEPQSPNSENKSMQNSIPKVDEEAEVQQKIDPVNKQVENIGNLDPDSLNIIPQNSMISADSILNSNKNNKLPQDSTLLKPKKKKFIIWD